MPPSSPVSMTLDRIPRRPTTGNTSTWSFRSEKTGELTYRPVTPPNGREPQTPMAPEKPRATFTTGGSSASEGQTSSEDGIASSEDGTTSGETTPTMYSSQQMAGSRISLTFNNDGLLYGAPESSTVAFPDQVYMLPSEQNGTKPAEVVSMLKSPKSSATHLGKVGHKRVRSFKWKSVTSGLDSLKDLASETLADRLNRAFHGKDVPEMAGKLVDIVPKVELSSRYQLDKAIDSAFDFLGEVFNEMRSPKNQSGRHHVRSIASNFHGSDLMFAGLMSEKAKAALVTQGICQPADLIPVRGKLDWSEGLRTALLTFHEKVKNEYRVPQLLDMTPVWIGDQEKLVWKLLLDTGVPCLNEATFELEDTNEQLDTGFDLLEQHDWLQIRDYTRGTKDDENGEWEEVDRL